MQINPESEKPIFVQVEEGLENDILTGIYKEEDQIPSMTELSVSFNINPATALKGINMLVDQGIIYKKRGMGSFVKKGAVKILKDKRKNNFKKDFIAPLLEEAKDLEITKDEIIELIKDY